jgi:hypothetical protein
MCFIDNLIYFLKIIIKNKYNITFIQFLLIHYIFKRWKNIIYIQDIIIVHMYEIVKIQVHFQSIYLIFLLMFLDRCVDIGKIFNNEIYLFSFGQSMEKIIMVKVGCFCM